ncbi:hypothetical protein CWI39_1747p0010 [Hamiltosporidium magnivora]|uniref:Uncharacterized protein n=1 Tax=Hamiltosporidium magnivora TaxID=148818 RepID=A0A4Q9KYZ2_9MICR|nr:hypothetical protein CWI39_1747p0010 [Hamiltosporidium magnivora]
MDKDDVMQTLTAETVDTIDNDDLKAIEIEKTEEYVSQGQNELENTYISLSIAHSEVEIGQSKFKIWLNDYKKKLKSKKCWKNFFSTFFRLLVFFLFCAGMFWFLYTFVLCDIIKLIYDKISKALFKLFNPK